MSIFLVMEHDRLGNAYLIGDGQKITINKVTGKLVEIAPFSDFHLFKQYQPIEVDVVSVLAQSNGVEVAMVHSGNFNKFDATEIGLIKLSERIDKLGNLITIVIIPRSEVQGELCNQYLYVYPKGTVIPSDLVY